MIFRVLKTRKISRFLERIFLGERGERNSPEQFPPFPPIRHHGIEESVESGAMIGMKEMTELVHHYPLHARLGAGGEKKTQADLAILPIASSPASGKMAYPDPDLVPHAPGLERRKISAKIDVTKVGRLLAVELPQKLLHFFGALRGGKGKSNSPLPKNRLLSGTPGELQGIGTPEIGVFLPFFVTAERRRRKSQELGTLLSNPFSFSQKVFLRLPGSHAPGNPQFQVAPRKNFESHRFGMIVKTSYPHGKRFLFFVTGKLENPFPGLSPGKGNVFRVSFTGSSGICHLWGLLFPNDQ